MLVRASSPLLHELLGVFLPLITTNCAVLGVALINLERQHGFVESLVFGAAAGAGLRPGAARVRRAARAPRDGRCTGRIPRHAARAGHRGADGARVHGLRRPRRAMNDGTLLPAVGLAAGLAVAARRGARPRRLAAAHRRRLAGRAHRRAAAADPVRPVPLSRLPAIRGGDRPRRGGHRPLPAGRRGDGAGAGDAARPRAAPGGSAVRRDQAAARRA